MDNTQDYVWYSGDWRPQNNDRIPYNGIKIEATPNYSPITSPPSKRKLVSVEAVITDFTKNPKGIASTVKLSKAGLWYDIPIPEKSNVSPPEPDTNFTVTSIYLDGNPGKMQLQTTTNGVYLRIQFRYGETNRTQEELGFILRFNETIE